MNKTLKLDRSKKRNQPYVELYFPSLRETNRHVYYTDIRQDALEIIKLLDKAKKLMLWTLKEWQKEKNRGSRRSKAQSA